MSTYHHDMLSFSVWDTRERIRIDWPKPSSLTLDMKFKTRKKIVFPRDAIVRALKRVMISSGDALDCASARVHYTVSEVVLIKWKYYIKRRTRFAAGPHGIKKSKITVYRVSEYSEMSFELFSLIWNVICSNIYIFLFSHEIRSSRWLYKMIFVLISGHQLNMKSQNRASEYTYWGVLLSVREEDLNHVAYIYIHRIYFAPKYCRAITFSRRPF